jgi:hypothetical protein
MHNPKIDLWKYQEALIILENISKTELNNSCSIRQMAAALNVTRMESTVLLNHLLKVGKVRKDTINGHCYYSKVNVVPSEEVITMPPISKSE